MKKKILLLPLVIATVGTAIWLFMIALSFVVVFFQENWNYLVAILPIVTLMSAFVHRLHQMHRLGDTGTLIEEIRNPKSHVHWLLAPWTLITTLIFHFFGASVGRESTAVQMGGSLAETLGRMLRIPTHDRPILIRMGLAAGFGAAFGVPWAGAVFGLESPLLARKRDWLHLPLIVFASWGGDRWAQFLGLRHEIWKTLAVPHGEFAATDLLALTFFLVFVALVYELLCQFAKKGLSFTAWWVGPLIGGTLIAIFTLWLGEPLFNNLGTSLIQSSFENVSSLFHSIGKLGFTLISTVAGMKGGEVTPLMASGALFGSWFAGLIHFSAFQVGSAIGLVTLFTSRLRIPFTGAIMLWEIFDWKIALLGVPTLLLIEFGHRQLVSKLS